VKDRAINNAESIVPQQVKYLLKLCKNRRVAVQAGGWQGTAPAMLARHFDLVYTYEPDRDNFYRLIEKVIEWDVIPMFGLLSDKRGRGGIYQHTKHNTGDYRSQDKGDIPRYMIDDLGLDACDLIWLDIQGDEYEALNGALRTIDEFSPVIGFEYAKSKCPQTGDVDAMLLGLGYEFVGTNHLDRFYTR
jgi:FkbM family methyltransferase